MAEKAPVPLARAGVWAGDLASALGRAHKAGVIHGDVKPANIFVTDEGQIKLGDFGIARFATQVSGAASLVGTPAYLSPEQIKGETQDHRSDIFSVGIVLYQLTTGVRPFDGSSVAAVCAQIVAKQPAPPSRHNPALPPEFDRIVMRCLAKNPADRYASGESLAASLYPFARSKPQPVPYRFNFSSLKSWFNRPLRPSDKWIYGGVVAAALVAIPVAHSFYRDRHGLAAASSQRSVSVSASSLDAAPQQPSVNLQLVSSDPRAASNAAPLGAVNRSQGAGLPNVQNLSSRPERPGRQPLIPALPTGTTTSKLSVARTPSANSIRASSAALAVEISSAIDGATLAIFVDQQLIATSPLRVTPPGESLHLDRPLPAGPHEFRVALYRQDKTLQTQKQGLAELQPGPSNQLTVYVVRRSKMLVKRNADLDILWPSASSSRESGSSNSAPKSGPPDTQASKGSTPLVATSVPSSR
jgi:serine/threonine protein kinase